MQQEPPPESESWGFWDVVGLVFGVVFPAYFVFSIVNVMTIGHTAALIGAGATAGAIVLVVAVASSRRWQARKRRSRGVTRRAFAAHPRVRTWFLWLAIGGPVALLVGVGGWSDASGLRDHGIRTEAHIVAVKHIKSDANYFLRFTLQNGTIGTCNTDEVDDSSADVAVGNHIKIVYDSTDSENCQGAGYGTGNDGVLAKIFTGVGTLAIPAAIFLFGYVRVRYGRMQRRVDAAVNL